MGSGGRDLGCAECVSGGDIGTMHTQPHSGFYCCFLLSALFRLGGRVETVSHVLLAVL